ncbi:alpha/beta fold hydrolase [Massilia sp. HP4]|uniref:alpha/beta fold hydrolase n=1 Tax=Massilia sp. HP4 TaxID=2562316 RepID=UPI0019818BC6|nr:alpha/beta hydrolase [Massilia sp. HP4]
MPSNLPTTDTSAPQSAARRAILLASSLAGLGLAPLPSMAAEAPPLRRHKLRVNGETFHVIEQGSGPAVLFCHGFPDTAETWRSQMRAVAAAGYRAVALDMRGFGDSFAPPDASQYTSLHIVGDLVGVLDALKIDSAVIVGHDWGADHAQRAALLRPDRFRALVSISIPYAPRGDIDTWSDLRKRGLGERYYALDWIRPGRESLFAPAAKSIPAILYWPSASPLPAQRWDPVDPARSMLRPAPVAAPSWADPAYVRHTVQAFDKSGFQGGLNYYRALPITFELTSAYRNTVIRQPSLYIWGAADGLCRFFHPTTPSLEQLRRTQPNLVRQVRLENVGHWVQHEAAERLNAELLAFLGALAPR